MNCLNNRNRGNALEEVLFWQRMECGWADQQRKHVSFSPKVQSISNCMFE